ncbi:hypothetical protein [Mycobacterium celatum]|uniref:hypothetical protein n=1 Tax=Mycobacterium celatum TaxID=28045 RepID=UPI000ADC9A3A|nr:hypothetical protein [Mycobacterium celatum]
MGRIAGRLGKWQKLLLLAGVALVAVVVAIPWLLRTHPDENPLSHPPAPKGPHTTVTAGEDCGSYYPPGAKKGKVDIRDTKIVVNRGSTTCGEATRTVTNAYNDAAQADVDFPVGDGWNCVSFDGSEAALAGYKLKCDKNGTEIRLVFVLNRDESNSVDFRLYRTPPGAPGIRGEAYAFSSPEKNIWCQISLGDSRTVRDVVCQGALPPDAPLVNGSKPNSVVLEAAPSNLEAHFAVLDRIIDFVPPLPIGASIQVGAVECVATGPDELTCTANRGTSYEHGFTISPHKYAFH